MAGGHPVLVANQGGGHPVLVANQGGGQPVPGGQPDQGQLDCGRSDVTPAAA